MLDRRAGASFCATVSNLLFLSPLFHVKEDEEIVLIMAQ